ncbi:hypothetical protein QYS49_05490 [Marivirga salinae]|uniref:Uncharacterized protein n=1 Tax=Marivirga salinarum TaxID=3059078 RepID=A0AA49JBP2_9BACT|nr:hypothetical protein [Marivirga sp. BDSF4-3]WKK76735.1 hypothetical protein QYS49_05490 [Marivirga sp. BDSF4-3]
MNLSLGFITILFLIIFPGVIFRRLYFYGEFSKEFRSNYNLITLIAISSIPGVILLIITSLLYNSFDTINLDFIIDYFKEIKSNETKPDDDTIYPITLNEIFASKIAPFTGLLYSISIASGLVLGRAVRKSRIDTKFKLLRFRNYWFYLFNGHHTSFKKLKGIQPGSNKHLFTRADILIGTGSDSTLYSGIVVDYELKENDCSSLNKIMLQSARRYKTKFGRMLSKDIPGHLLIVDCENMSNINLTYVSEKRVGLLETKLPGIIPNIIGTTLILLIPLFIFEIEKIDWLLYEWYFDLPWYAMILSYLLVVEVLTLLNPFRETDDGYEWNGWVYYVIKVIAILFTSVLIYWLS